jgi:hypothetical protein
MPITRTTSLRVGGLTRKIAERAGRILAAFYETVSDEDRNEVIRQTIRGLVADRVIAPMGDPPFGAPIEERRTYYDEFERELLAAVRTPIRAIRTHRTMLRVCREWQRGESA